MGLFSSSPTQFTQADPQSRSAWFDNINQANNLPQYQGFNAGMLSQFQNPYEDQVVKGALGDLEQFRQMGVNQTGDAAQAAGAFGGSRHGVAESLTNADYGRQAGLLSSSLRSQGFNTSLQAVLQQLAARNQYGLDRQGTINQSVSLLRPNYKQSSGDDVGKMVDTAASVAKLVASFSDRRLKRDIVHLSTREDGLKIYSFRYLWGKKRHIGVMAQEAIKLFPKAVLRHWSGFLMVNYGAL